MTATARLTGISSVVGGAALTAACFVHNSLPQGCIDEGCDDGHAMRGHSPTADALVLVGGIMLACAGIGLLLLARERGGLGRTGVAAGVAGALGLLLLGAAVVATTIDDEWNGMPGLVVPGVLLLVVGLVLVAVAVVRASVVPVWCSALLLVTALVLLFANEQTSRVLLAVPFALAWLVLGVVLLRQPVAERPAVGPAAGTA